MTTYLKTNSGSNVSCWIQGISESKSHRIVVTDLPTASLDYLQNLGSKNRTFTIDGTIYGADGVSQVRSLPGTTGSLQFINDFGQNMIPQVQLFYTNYKLSDKDDEPFVKKFSLEAIEVL